MHPDVAALGVSKAHVATMTGWVRNSTGFPAAPEWTLVYKASRDGWDGGVRFHGRCDGRARLLVLIRVAEGGWLCGGFTGCGRRQVQRRFVGVHLHADQPARHRAHEAEAIHQA